MVWDFKDVRHVPAPPWDSGSDSPRTNQPFPLTQQPVLPPQQPSRRARRAHRGHAKHLARAKTEEQLQSEWKQVEKDLFEVVPQLTTEAGEGAQRPRGLLSLGRSNKCLELERLWKLWIVKTQKLDNFDVLLKRNFDHWGYRKNDLMFKTYIQPGGAMQSEEDIAPPLKRLFPFNGQSEWTLRRSDLPSRPFGRDEPLDRLPEKPKRKPIMPPGQQQDSARSSSGSSSCWSITIGCACTRSNAEVSTTATKRRNSGSTSRR
ncbi:unnamed protein product [Vitrella brassicaformis CCMP3155]|uniref:Uncharacterized protein n=1 Tax=Vitrella brassicaformis (strain CCMP3155) TaxID=1169540 RepID=A0A0G4ERE1_VITBC|nr:unnamed protein product [Vitrella brassicaformis CCMP3155]|eukprot:CEM00599.1 unnamed protein product [Vitrella brassicaformis CCMP3155]